MNFEMSPLQNKLSLKTFELVYPFEYNFKCHYNTIAPGHLIEIYAYDFCEN